MTRVTHYARRRLLTGNLSFPLDHLQRLLPVPADPQVDGPTLLHRPNVGDPPDDLGPASPATHVLIDQDDGVIADVDELFRLESKLVECLCGRLEKLSDSAGAVVRLPIR